MSSGFVHSVKVPRIYKLTADIVRRVRENGASLKNLIYGVKHPNVSGIYGLSMNTLQMLPILDQLLQTIQIFMEQPRLDCWLARVLITELLWGKKCLRNNSKPVLTILAYENKLQAELKNLKCMETLISHKKKVQKPRYVRINTLMLSVEKAISIFQKTGWKLLSKNTTYSSYLQSLSQLSEPYFIQDFHIPEVLAFPFSTSFHQHPGYQSGELILQDKASCLPVHLLDPISGSTVLDMCAAPGMKATYVAAKLRNHGTVYAVEMDAKRFETLCSQIETTHAFCVKPIEQDALTLDPKRYLDVEYILVDPSCSGSGIIDRPIQNNMDARSDSERLLNLQSFQVYLLRYALLNFPNVKRIIYSTCSLYPEENEKVIDEVLTDIGDAYYLVPVKKLLNDWTNFSSQKYNCKDRCLYSKPNVDFCNGFFIAIFERNFKVNLPKCKRKGGNINRLEANLSIAKNEMIKEVAHMKKKYEKNRNNKEKISIDREIQISGDIAESIAFEVKRTIKTKKKKKVKKNEKITLDRSKNIQRKPIKEKNYKKTEERKKLKNKDILQVVKNKKIAEICDVRKEKQNKKWN